MIPLADNAPEISGARQDLPLTGDEPVIAGINSQVLVERRGAYLAGNLNVLLRLMSAQQVDSLNRWCLQVTRRKLVQTSPSFEVAFPDAIIHQQVIDGISQWGCGVLSAEEARQMTQRLEILGTTIPRSRVDIAPERQPQQLVGMYLYSSLNKVARSLYFLTSEQLESIVSNNVIVLGQLLTAQSLVRFATDPTAKGQAVREQLRSGLNPRMTFYEIVKTIQKHYDAPNSIRSRRLHLQASYVISQRTIR